MNPPNPELFSKPIDSREAIAQTLQDGMRDARVGILYLFSNLQVGCKHTGNLLPTLTAGTGLVMGQGEGSDSSASRHEEVPTMHVPDLTRRWMPQKSAQGRQAAAVITPGASEVSTLSWMREYLRGVVMEIWDQVAGYLRRMALKVSKACGSLIDSALHKPHALIEQIAVAVMRVTMSPVLSWYPAWNAAKEGMRQLFQEGIGTLRADIALGTGQINAGFTQYLFDGLRSTAYFKAGAGCANMAVGFLTAPLSLLKKEIAAPVRAITKLVRNIAAVFFRVYESLMLKKLATEAKTILGAGGYMSYGRYSPGAACRTALPGDPEAFDAWFRPYALCVPAVSSLVVASRVCVYRDLYLNLFGHDGAMKSTGQYDTGVAYISHLKGVAERYLDSSGLECSYGDSWLTKHMANITKAGHAPASLAGVGEVASMPLTGDRAAVRATVWNGIFQKYRAH